jgi:hypothetical protein
MSTLFQATDYNQGEDFDRNGSGPRSALRSRASAANHVARRAASAARRAGTNARCRAEGAGAVALHSSQAAIAVAGQHLPGAIATARTQTDAIVTQLPEATEMARARLVETTHALQRMPDSRLQQLAAASAGAAAGLYAAGAPRVIVLGAVVPAILAEAAIVSRPAKSNGVDALSLFAPETQAGRAHS